MNLNDCHLIKLCRSYLVSRIEFNPMEENL